ncbi:hypothetical protein BV20DRAFT_713765 [Pilatotrama ljubarskyi]|nr:hypothetical protein BV20DRAFT_713765 [Pilatotrama ljubarskyi]
MQTPAFLEVPLSGRRSLHGPFRCTHRVLLIQASRQCPVRCLPLYLERSWTAWVHAEASQTLPGKCRSYHDAECQRNSGYPKKLVHLLTCYSKYTSDAEKRSRAPSLVTADGIFHVDDSRCLYSGARCANIVAIVQIWRPCVDIRNSFPTSRRRTVLVVLSLRSPGTPPTRSRQPCSLPLHTGAREDAAGSTRPDK